MIAWVTARAPAFLLALVGATVINGTTTPTSSHEQPGGFSKATSHLSTETHSNHGNSRPTDLRDLTIVIQTLPNGLRYYLQPNSLPVNRVELRLVVKTGSLQEDDDQSGMAHFLEHMAFNGTTRFPANRVMDIVESMGMNFGADLNAYTSFEETIYRLTVPSDDPAALQQGLQILEDWSNGSMLLDSASVAAERGVILQERRLRYDPLAFAMSAQMFHTLRGPESRFPQRFPIGKAEQIETATPEPLRRFYRDWYRPDLMAIVVVGQFDLPTVEREIRRTFGQIPRPENPRKPYVDPIKERGARAFDIYRQAGAPTVLSMSWRKPPLPSSPRDVIVRELHERLLREYLTTRMRALATQHMRAFTRAAVSRTKAGRDFEALTLQIYAQPDSLLSGLRAALTEIERVAQHGIPAPILERQKAAILRELEQEADDEGRTPSRVLADRLVEHYFVPNTPLLSAAQYETMVHRVLPTVTPASIARVAQFWRDDSHRFVSLTVSQANNLPMFTQDELEMAVTEVRRKTLTDHVSQDVSVSHTSSEPSASGKSKPVTQKIRHTPGTIVTERRHPMSGITEWVLSNGARVIHRKTAEHPGEVYLQAYHMGGLSQLPDSLVGTSGRLLGELLTTETPRSERIFGIVDGTVGTPDGHMRTSLNYIDADITLTGAPRELESMFQQLYETLIDTMLDSSRIVAWKKRGLQPNSFSENYEQMRRYTRSTRRSDGPSRIMADNIRLNHVRAVFTETFGDASALTFIIVGAVSAEQVRPLVERYSAALPSSGSAMTSVRPLTRPQPQALSLVSNRYLQGNRTSGFQGGLLDLRGTFPTTPDDYLRERQRFKLVAWITQRRFRNLLRERLGGAYSVHAMASVFETPTPSWGLYIAWACEGRRVNELIDAAEKELEELRTQGPSADELRLAQTVQQRTLETQLQSNNFWITTIQDYLRLDIPLDRVTSPYTPQTIGEMQEAAKRYLEVR